MRLIRKVGVTFLVLGLLLMVIPASAQLIKTKHKGYNHHFDSKSFGFGFMMGVSYNSYKFKQQYNVFDEGMLLDRVTLLPQPGLNLGVISNLNIHNNYSLRLIPAISLEERQFVFHFSQPQADTQIRKVEAAILDIPLLLQIKSDYYKRTRVYFLTGPEVSINFQSNKKLNDDRSLIKVQKTTFNWVVGTGVNIYGDRVKLTPELRYSIAFTDDYVPRNTSHATAISKLFRQVLTLNIMFE